MCNRIEPPCYACRHFLSLCYVRTQILVTKPYRTFLNQKVCHHPFDISLYTDFLSLIFRAPAKKMILARRMKFVLLTTNQTLMFVSVLEVSGDLFGERQKQLWKRDILKMPGTDKWMKDQGCNFHYKNI